MSTTVRENNFGLLSASEHVFAFKRISKNEHNPDYGIDNMLEIDILCRINHPNIIHSSQITVPEEYKIRDPIIILPLADYTLSQLSTDLFLTTRKKLPILYRLAHALRFLHQNSIVHLNLNFDDVVIQSIDGEFNPLVTNFSMARFLPTSLDHSTDIFAFANIFCNFLGHKRLSTVTTFDDKLFDDQFKNISQNYKYLCKDLISKIFMSDVPPTFDDICNHHIFDEYRRNIDDKIIATVELPLSTISVFPPDHRDIVKIIYAWITSLYKDHTIFLLFLSIDLFNRSTSFFVDSPSEDRLDLAAACVWIALKLIIADENPSILVSSLIEKLSGIVPTLKKDKILSLEPKIIQSLNGILMSNLLFSSCQTIGHLELSIQHIILNKENPNIYAVLDISQWNLTMNQFFPDQNPIPHKYLSISNFINKTF